MDTSAIEIEGRILLNGMDHKKVQMSRNAVFVSSQDISIPNLTVRENVEFVYDCLVPLSRGQFLESVIKENRGEDIESQSWKELEEGLMYVSFLPVPCHVSIHQDKF